MLNVDEEPEVGKPYQGKALVTEIKTDVKLLDDGQTRTRKVITMDNGVIYKLDHFIREAAPSKPSSSKSKADPSGGASSSKSKSKSGAPPDSPKKASSKSSGNLTDDVGDEADDESPRKAHSSKSPKRSPKKAASPKIIPPAKAASGKPLAVFVYGEEDPSLQNLPKGKPRGIWELDEENPELKEDSKLWKPQEIILHKPGDDVGRALNLDDDTDTDLPTGVWGYPQGQTPPPEEMERENGWHPKDVARIVPPFERSPAGFVPAGRYSYKPGALNRTWPPPVDNIKKQLKVGKLNIPKPFLGGKLPIKVFPKSRVPNMTDRSKRGGAFKPVGCWMYPEGSEHSDDHFMPMDIDLYLGDAKPLNHSSDEGSLTGSWGYWGSSHGSVNVDDPDWKPEMSIVFPPGVEPDTDDVEVLGRWTMPLGQYTKLEWPPTNTKSATVFPRTSAPLAESNKTKGVWSFGSKKDKASEENWKPQEVELYNRNDTIDAGRPNGRWGIRHGAEPDKEWNWMPEDVYFFPPGEDSDDDCWIQGKWALPAASKKGDWPPKPSTNANTRSVGALSIPNCFQDGKSVPIRVFPRSKFPSQVPPGKRVGQWAYPNQQEEDDRHFMPQQVDLFFGDQNPPMPDDGSLTDIGVWASAPKDPFRTKPSTGRRGHDSGYLGDDNDNDNDKTNRMDDDPEDNPDWSPENSLVFPPGVLPDPGLKIRGKWAFPGKLAVSWPPSQSRTATVYGDPKQLTSTTTPGTSTSTSNTTTRGIWKPSATSTDPNSRNDSKDWAPQTVQLLGPLDLVDDTRPHGTWGLRKGAPLDDSLNYAPQDIWFYPPGEGPSSNKIKIKNKNKNNNNNNENNDDDCQIQGRWQAMPSQSSSTSLVSWPPPSSSNLLSPARRSPKKLDLSSLTPTTSTPRSLKAVGKLKIPGAFASSPLGG